MSKTRTTVDDPTGVLQMTSLTLQDAEHAGATGRVIKPFRPEQLLAVTRIPLR